MERVALVKMKIMDVSSFDDGLFEGIVADIFDPDRFDVVRSGKGADEEKICEMMKDASIVMTDPFHFQPVIRRIIEAADNLKLIYCYTIGFDDVDLEAARERDVPVANAVEAHRGVDHHCGFISNQVNLVCSLRVEQE